MVTIQIITTGTAAHGH